jgi:hypothetical protein
MPARKTKPPAVDPPTVADVRAARAKMWREAGGTVKGLIELARKEATGVGKRKRRRGAA